MCMMYFDQIHPICDTSYIVFIAISEMYNFPLFKYNLKMSLHCLIPIYFLSIENYGNYSINDTLERILSISCYKYI
jgi:hypothetical protein